MLRYSSVAAAAWIVCVVGCDRPSNTYAPPPPPEVSVAHPLEKELTDDIFFTGTTDAIEKVELRARVKGFLAKVHYDPGSIVESGTLLFTIDPRTFEALVQSNQAKVDAADAELKLAAVNLDKVKQLTAQGAATDIELRERQADFDSATAALDLARANLASTQLDLEFTKVTAPMTGNISRNLVDPGALVGAGDPTLLATIVRSDRLYVYFEITESELLAILKMMEEVGRPRGEKSTPIFVGTQLDEGYPFEGVFDSADPEVDPNTGTLRMRAIVDNENDLLAPGLFVRIRIPISTKEELLVPELATGRDQGGTYVMVVGADNKVSRRSVVLGRAFGDLVRVASGLVVDDLVVVDGVQRARPGIVVAPETVELSAPSDAAVAAVEAVTEGADSDPGTGEVRDGGSGEEPSGE